MAKSNRRRGKPKVKKAKAIGPKVTIVNGRKRIETLNPPPADLDPALTWYLVYTGPRVEPKVKKELEDCGCKVFWPSSHVVITAPKRKPVEHDVGTFPRYMFVAGMPFRQQYRDRVIGDNQVVTVNGRPVDDIRDIEGVVEVVGTSAGWLRVPGAAIAAIANYQANKVELKPKPVLGTGDRVRIIDGPFMRFLGTIVEEIGLDEAKVLIDILGGQVPVTMAIAQLNAA